MHNNVIQSISTLCFATACAFLFYHNLFKLPEILFLALCSLIIVLSILSCVYDALEEYNKKLKSTIPISLSDLNNYIRINPSVWLKDGVKFFNCQTKEFFSLAIWEWIIFKCCKKLGIDAKTKAINDATYQNLCNYVQKDIDKKREQNQREIQRSLEAISKTRQAQKDIITSYSEQVHKITKDF